MTGKSKLESHEDSSLCGHDQPKEIQWYYAVFILLNGLIESTTLNIPYIYHKSGGILVTVSLQLVLLPVLFLTMVALVVCAKAKRCSSYQGVMAEYIGPKFGVLTSIFIAMYLLGSTTSYFVAIADQWQLLVQAIREDETSSAWYVDRRFLLCVTSAFTMLPLSLFKSIDSLAIPSSIAFLIYIYCVFLVVIKYFTGINDSKVGQLTTKPESFYRTISGIPNFAVLYDCHLQILLLYGIHENGRYEYLKAISMTTLASFSFYNFIGIFGFLSFGSCVHPDILLSYQPTAEVLVATFGIVIKLALAYPVASHVARSVTYSLVENVTNKNVELLAEGEELKLRIVVTVVWFCSSLLLSMAFKDIDKITVVTGGITVFFVLDFSRRVYLSVAKVIVTGIMIIKYSLAVFLERRNKILGISFSVLCILLGCSISIISVAEKVLHGIGKDSVRCANDSSA